MVVVAANAIGTPRLLLLSEWQRRQFPVELQTKIEVIHDGIDTDKVTPDASARVSLKRQGVVRRAGDEVVTFVNRNLEPYRGYHIFMRALPKILAARPNARAIIIGGDDGLAPALRERATLRIAFGAATWPHQLVRGMLLEQIYRAITILAGHPYHRA